jgi:hypothetical protein
MALPSPCKLIVSRSQALGLQVAGDGLCLRDIIEFINKECLKLTSRDIIPTEYTRGSAYSISSKWPHKPFVWYNFV